MENRYKVVRYVAFGLELILLFVLQSTPNLMPEILGGKPLLLLPAAVTISFFEPERPAAAFGIACGALLDIASGGTPGFFTVCLAIVCFTVSSVFRDYMVVSFLNALAFVAAVSAGMIILQFLIFYVFTGKPDALWYFAHHYLARIIYTIIMGYLLYFLNKWLHRSLR